MCDDDVRVLATSPAYCWRRVSPRTPHDLGVHDCIVCVARQPFDTWYFRTAPAAENVRTVHVDGRLTVSNTLALRDAALAGLGIADLPRYLVAEDLREGRLVSMLPAFVMTG